MYREAQQAAADAPQIQGATDKRQLFSLPTEISDLESLGIICSARSYRLSPSKVIRKGKHQYVEKSVFEEIKEWQREMLESVSGKAEASKTARYIVPTEKTELCITDRHKESDMDGRKESYTESGKDCGIVSRKAKSQRPLILNPSSLCRTTRC